MKATSDVGDVRIIEFKSIKSDSDGDMECARFLAMDIAVRVGLGLLRMSDDKSDILSGIDKFDSRRLGSKLMPLLMSLN